MRTRRTLSAVNNWREGGSVGVYDGIAVTDTGIQRTKGWHQVVFVRKNENVLNEATVEDVYDIYVNAWKNNLKGITIYRDGCKRSGILVNEKPKENKKAFNSSSFVLISLIMYSSPRFTSYKFIVFTYAYKVSFI